MDDAIINWGKTIIGIIFAIWMTRQIYTDLAKYKGWQSPWKRLLFISPVILAFIFTLSAFWYVTTH
jgi:hypothetical protein